MTRVQVWVDIPDGYELACDEMRPPKVGEQFIGSDGNLLTGREEHYLARVIVRPAWQWPAWLMAAAIVSYGKTWYCCELVPILTKDGWAGCGMMRILDQALFDFTPPPCTDWRQSLRLNPNRDAKS